MSLRSPPLAPALFPLVDLLGLLYWSGAQVWLQPLLVHLLPGILSILKNLQATFLLTERRTIAAANLVVQI
jgi:hypothetical protein